MPATLSPDAVVRFVADVRAGRVSARDLAAVQGAVKFARDRVAAALGKPEPGPSLNEVIAAPKKPATWPTPGGRQDDPDLRDAQFRARGRDHELDDLVAKFRQYGGGDLSHVDLIARSRTEWHELRQRRLTNTTLDSYVALQLQRARDAEQQRADQPQASAHFQARAGRAAPTTDRAAALAAEWAELRRRGLTSTSQERYVQIHLAR